MKMTTIKEWLNANVWANGAIKEDLITQQELLQIVTNCIAATQPQWMSVEERLPLAGDNGFSIQIFFFNGKSWVGHYDKEKSEWWSSDSFEVIYAVTHWMPLPTPPEPEK